MLFFIFIELGFVVLVAVEGGGRGGGCAVCSEVLSSNCFPTPYFLLLEKHETSFLHSFVLFSLFLSKTESNVIFDDGSVRVLLTTGRGYL